MKRYFIALSVISLLGSVAYAQNSDKKADYFSAQDIQKQLADLAPKSQAAGSSGATLGDYGSHRIQLSVRNASGGAEIHAHYDDVFVVQRGHATLTTGGSVIDGKTTPDGETKGSGISDGHTQELSAGDVVNIPAGTPHQLKLAPGVPFSTIVVKVRE
jgi:mannose-6-phosphate isomerase-like protein (cupin superfamily)